MVQAEGRGLGRRDEPGQGHSLVFEVCPEAYKQHTSLSSASEPKVQLSHPTSALKWFLSFLQSL